MLSSVILDYLVLWLVFFFRFSNVISHHHKNRTIISVKSQNSQKNEKTFFPKGFIFKMQALPPQYIHFIYIFNFIYSYTCMMRMQNIL